MAGFKSCKKQAMRAIIMSRFIKSRNNTIDTHYQEIARINPQLNATFNFPLPQDADNIRFSRCLILFLNMVQEIVYPGHVFRYIDGQKKRLDYCKYRPTSNPFYGIGVIENQQTIYNCHWAWHSDSLETTRFLLSSEASKLWQKILWGRHGCRVSRKALIVELLQKTDKWGSYMHKEIQDLPTWLQIIRYQCPLNQNNIILRDNDE